MVPVYTTVANVPWQVNFLVWTLAPIACLNAFYTLTRTRQYRLFEANVESNGPSTPSAHRVRVDSSPASSSPLRLLQNLISSESAEARAHPDKTRDVWEISVWDPYPATLRIFCLFSPGHILIHLLFLPLAPLDPRPSVTVFKCLALQVILSAQLLLLNGSFSRQAKDTAIIQKEVLHEYDTKYVHPRLHPVVREVGTQVSINDIGIDEESVEVGTPSTLIRRGFETHPNPNYAKFVNPDGVPMQSRSVSTMSPAPTQFTPLAKPPRASDNSFAAQLARASRHSLPAQPTRPPPQQAASPMVAPATPSAELAEYKQAVSRGLGGCLGVYTSANSPLKKATSMNDMGTSYASPRNNREMAAQEQREQAERMIRQSSPLKSSPVKDRRATMNIDPSAYLHSPNTLATARANRWNQERFPTRRL